jgi:hypothetical protein
MKHNPVSEVVRVEAGAAECAAFDHRDRHSAPARRRAKGDPVWPAPITMVS